MKLANFFVLCIIVAVLTGCNANEQKQKTTVDTTTSPPKKDVLIQKPPIDSTVLQVYIDSSGLITANGQSISLNSLDSSLKKLKARNGKVFYSRDNPVGDPPKESMKVIELATKYSLPIQFYTDKTFTEIVKMN